MRMPERMKVHSWQLEPPADTAPILGKFVGFHRRSVGLGEHQRVVIGLAETKRGNRMANPEGIHASADRKIRARRRSFLLDMGLGNRR